MGKTGICILRFEGGTGDNKDAVGIIFQLKLRSSHTTSGTLKTSNLS